MQKAESMYKYVISSISMYSNCSFLEKEFIVENVLMHSILMFPIYLFLNKSVIFKTFNKSVT